MRYEYNLETGEMIELENLPPAPQADQLVIEAPAQINPVEKLKQFLAENPDVAAILK